MKVADWVEGETPALHMHALEELGGVRALFSGRSGGVSPRWQGGLNWSRSVGDELNNVQENRRRTLALMGLTPGSAIMAGLIHGDRVVAVTDRALNTGSDQAQANPNEAGSNAEVVQVIPDCDALITDRPGLGLVATAADCVPIYLYDPVRRVIGIAHAGWRGTVAGIAGKTAKAMAERYGCALTDIHAVVGPSIGPCCFEVDDQVAQPIRQAYGLMAEDLLLEGRLPGKYQLDLWETNRLDLRRIGVKHVAVAGECTSCGVDRLFSHRAERGQAGRGAAVIAML